MDIIIEGVALTLVFTPNDEIELYKDNKKIAYTEKNKIHALTNDYNIIISWCVYTLDCNEQNIIWE